MKTILGPRIRERRRQLKISQAELARQVGISASYQNLIEHNKRAISGKLLVRTAEALDLQIEALDGATEHRLLSTLEEIAHIPRIATIGVEGKNSGELIGRYPGWARAIAALARSEHKATETARALADRLTHDAFLGESVHRMLTSIASIRSADEILVDHPDIDKQHRNRFQSIINEECLTLTNVGESLASYFDKSDNTERVLTPLDEVEALFEARENRFEEIETIADSIPIDMADSLPGVRHKKALEFALSVFGECIAGIISIQPQIETEMARGQAKQALLTYAVSALLAPMNLFLSEAQTLRFDVESLAKSFLVSIDTVCHRLSALPKEPGIPRFGYFLANAAGTIVTMRNLPGLVSPRYAAACPLWVLYRAQQSPESMIRQRVLFPSGSQFVLLARARHIGTTGFDQPRHYVTDMLAVSDQDAAHTVYAPNNTVPLELVGSTCRSCPRRNCLHRVADPLSG